MKTHIFFLLFIGTMLHAPSAKANPILVPGALTHEKNASLKESWKGSIPIQNDSDQTLTVKVTLSDYSFNYKGESSFPPLNTTPRSNASWIESRKSSFEVAPHSTFSYAYDISVPDDPSLEGTYWSIFLIEPVQNELSAPEENQSLGVQTIIRYGVQIITHVGKKGKYDLKVLGKKVSQEDEKKTFILNVDNIGTLAQSPLLTLELIDSKGKKMGRFEAAKQRILPTCSTSYQIDISSVPKGKYKAMVILDHGNDALFGAQYELTMD